MKETYAQKRERKKKEKYSIRSAQRVLGRFFRQLLLVDGVRYVVGLCRFVWYAKILRRLKVWEKESKDVSVGTTFHNLKGIGSLAVSRSNQLIRPLSVIGPSYQHAKTLKVLSIGPRTEGEILNLMGHGYLLKNIRAIDLISYSPWIDLGDMHSMKYADGQFDVIISGWVLAYSDNKKKAADEMIRVAKNGAIIAIGVGHTPHSVEEIAQYDGYESGSKERLLCIDEILSLFKPHIEAVYMTQDAKNADQEIDLLTIFSVRK